MMKTQNKLLKYVYAAMFSHIHFLTPFLSIQAGSIAYYFNLNLLIQYTETPKGHFSTSETPSDHAVNSSCGTARIETPNIPYSGKATTTISY